MKTKNTGFFALAAMRARWVGLAIVCLTMIGFVPPATATLTGVTVGAPSGSPTQGAAGAVTYPVSVTKDNTNNGATTALSLSWNGTAPAGVTFSFAPGSLGASGAGTRTSTLTISSSASTPAAASNFTVRAQRNSSDFVTADGSLTVKNAAAQPQTISFGPLAAKIFGDPSFNVSATASSGLAVVFVANGSCSLSGNSVSLTGAGPCTVTASQPGNAGWQAAAAVAQTFSIAKAGQTITFNEITKKTIGDSFALGATASSTLPVSYAASGDCSVNGTTAKVTAPATPPGSCTITASQAGNINYAAATAVPRSFAVSAFAGAELYAVSGTAALAGQSVTVWGYNADGATLGRSGGPTLVYNQGDTVTIRLHNTLGESTGLLFQGQAMVPDTTGAAPGANKTYTFTASQPGTYLYEAALLPNTEHQTAMGLHGVLIVRPSASGRAYDDPATAYDDEAVLLLSEIDPALNNNPNPATFDMRQFAPRYFLINGKPYPTTDPVVSAAGRKVLLRYVNAGVRHHSMAVLGLRQNFVAKDASLLPTLTHNVAAETLVPGQTGDAIATLPASIATDSKFALYDASLMLHNNGTAGFGGMLTFVTAGGTETADTLGPVSTGVVVTSAGALTATVSDVGRGNSNVTSAEYFVDTTGANGSGLAISGAFGSPTVNLSATIASQYLSGNHTVFVHAKDAVGNWGPYAAQQFAADATGPTTSGLTLTPGSSNGTSDVVLRGTADDTASGGSNIVAAEYTFRGTTTAMTVSPSGAKVAGLAATLPATTLGALPAGAYPVSVRSQDSAGNWGAPASINLVVNKTGPVTSNVVAATNASLQVVRITAQITGSGVAAAEGFIDTVGAFGTGFQFVPSDGAFGGSFEAVYGNIPLATVNTLAAGTHTVHVRGRDASGNWGAASTGTLVVFRAVNDAVTITANNTATQNVDFNAAAGVLANDLPATGTASLATAPTRSAGSGTGTITLACASALGTSASPSVSGQTICANGAYRVVLTGVGNNGAARNNSKVGTFTFSYTGQVNGGSGTATVTITVNP